MDTKETGARKLTRRAVLGHMAGAGTLLAMPSIARATEKMGGELYFETFGGAYAEAVKSYIVEPFEEKYGVKVRLTNFGSGGEQLAKVQASNDRIDVTSLNGSRIYAAIKNDSLLPLDLAKIPNFSGQHPNFQKPAYEVGDGNNYSSALVWGDTAIAYNTDFVTEVPTSWEDFMRPELKGRTALFSSAMSLVHLGALMTGQDINNIQDLAAVESKLMELKPQLLKFWSSGSENTQLFATGEIWMANFWRGRVNKLREEGHPIQYTVPEEGAVAWVDCMVVPKTCQNMAAAEAFINMTLDPEVQKNFVTKGITYAPSNVDVKLTPEEQQMLGASPEIFETAKFVDSAYVAANQDQWNLLANRVKAS